MIITPSTTDHAITCDLALCDCFDNTACHCSRECECLPCWFCGAWCPEGEQIVPSMGNYRSRVLCPDCYNGEG